MGRIESDTYPALYAAPGGTPALAPTDPLFGSLAALEALACDKA